jgi:hypothetical protein
VVEKMIIDLVDAISLLQIKEDDFLGVIDRQRTNLLDMFEDVKIHDSYIRAQIALEGPKKKIEKYFVFTLEDIEKYCNPGNTEEKNKVSDYFAFLQKQLKSMVDEESQIVKDDLKYLAFKMVKVNVHFLEFKDHSIFLS